MALTMRTIPSGSVQSSAERAAHRTGARSASATVCRPALSRRKYRTTGFLAARVSGVQRLCALGANTFILA